MGSDILKLGELCALFFTGQKLRESGLLRKTDGETAAKLATYLTLPSVALQSLCTQGPVPYEAWLGLGVAAVCYATQTASNWIFCMSKPKQERAAITGSGTGLSLAMFGYPVGEAVFGLHGLQPLVLLDALNSVAVRVSSYLLAASAGPAFPESFKHEDGGVYRGQWRGMRKEGLGIYTYLSGARYEGEWRDNLKDGRGVYFFPKGGTYEGEWSRGTMEGVGVRTFSTGQVKCGRWKEGKLEVPLELWQCTNAAEGAAEAVGAARRVEVGGGGLKDALHQLMRSPSIWAVLAGLALSWSGFGLPVALDAVTSCLAPVHRPLMMLAAGLTLSMELPPPSMAGQVAQLVASRMIIPIFVCSTSLGVAGGTGDMPVAATVATVLLAFLTPIPPEASAYTRKFRLNEGLTSALTSASNLASLPLLLLCGLAISASGLFTAPPSVTPSTPLIPASSGSSVLPVLAFCVAATAVLGGWVVRAKGLAENPSMGGLRVGTAPVAAAAAAAAAGTSGQGGGVDGAGSPTSASGDQRVLMVYQGTPEARARLNDSSSGRPPGDGRPPGQLATDATGDIGPSLIERSSGKEGGGMGMGKVDGTQASSSEGQSTVGSSKMGEERGGADSSSGRGQGGGVGSVQAQEHLHGVGSSSSAPSHTSHSSSASPSAPSLEQAGSAGWQASREGASTGSSEASEALGTSSIADSSTSSSNHSHHQSVQQPPQHRGSMSSDSWHADGEKGTQRGSESKGPHSPSSSSINSPTLSNDGMHLEGEQRSTNGGDDPPPPPSSPSSTSTQALQSSCSQPGTHHLSSRSCSLCPQPWLSTRSHVAGSGTCLLLGTNSRKSRGATILHNQSLRSCVSRLRCAAVQGSHLRGPRLGPCGPVTVPSPVLPL